VQARLVITACYSGGFAELGWPKLAADEKSISETASQIAAGFFATSFDRPAAGCTSEADQADLRDYATCFWAALGGKWPDGKQVVEKVDLNGDDRVSYSEAHVFALVHDTTLDTPLKTSDFALRQISRFGRVEETNSLTRGPSLLTRDPSYAELLAAATPTDKHLLEQLSARVSLNGQRRLSQARQGLRKLELELRDLAERRAEQSVKDAALRKEHWNKFLESFPTLAKLIDQQKRNVPEIRQFLEKHDAELKRSVSDEDKALLNSSFTKLRGLDAARLLKESHWAAYQRFLQTAESVILAHNLPLVVEDKSVITRFEALLKAENGP
jgi:hypothetical protein